MNAYLNGGNILDVFSKMKHDILDTQSNQLTFLDNLYQAEDRGYAGSSARPFCVDGYQYNLVEEANSFVVKLCNTAEDSIVRLPKDGGEGELLSSTFDPGFRTIMDIEDKVQESVDSSELLNKLIATCDGLEDGQSLSQKFASQNQLWVSKSSSKVKNLYNEILDGLANTDDSEIGAMAILNKIYADTKTASQNADEDTGQYEFTGDTYHVQGFLGSYALSVAGAALATIAGVVITACNVVVGAVVMVAGTLISGIAKLIGMATDTQVQEKNSDNNLYAQPIFQFTTSMGYINNLNMSDDDGDTISACLNKFGSCTVRVPGWLVIFAKHPEDNTVDVEMFLSIDFGCKASDTFGFNDVVGGHASYPWFKYYGNNYSHTMTFGPAGVKSWYRHFFNSSFTAVNSSAAFIQGWSAITTGEESTSSMSERVDKMVRANVTMSLWFLFAGMSFSAYGAESTEFPNPGTSQIGAHVNVPSASGTTSLDWAGYFLKQIMAYYSSNNGDYSPFGMQWETIVNTVIPRVRNIWHTTSGSARPLEGLHYLMMWTEDPVLHTKDYLSISGGRPKVLKPKWCPPGISQSGLIKTGAVIIGIGVAAAVTAVVARKIKQHKTLKWAQADAQEYELRTQLGADPHNKDLQKRYLKSKRRLDRRSASLSGGSFNPEVLQAATIDGNATKVNSSYGTPSMFATEPDSNSEILTKVLFSIDPGAL